MPDNEKPQPIVDVALCPLCGIAQWNPTREQFAAFEFAHRICHVFDPILRDE